MKPSNVKSKVTVPVFGTESLPKVANKVPIILILHKFLLPAEAYRFFPV